MAAEVEILRLVDHTHPTPAELLHYAVMGNDLVNHEVNFSG